MGYRLKHKSAFQFQGATCGCTPWWFWHERINTRLIVTTLSPPGQPRCTRTKSPNQHLEGRDAKTLNLARFRYRSRYRLECLPDFRTLSNSFPPNKIHISMNLQHLGVICHWVRVGELIFHCNLKDVEVLRPWGLGLENSFSTAIYIIWEFSDPAS